MKLLFVAGFWSYLSMLIYKGFTSVVEFGAAKILTVQEIADTGTSVAKVSAV
jgi:hypothetical protein